MTNSTFPRVYGGPPELQRAQDNIQSVLGPVATAVQNTPIMGAAPPAWVAIAMTGGFTASATLAQVAYHRDALGYVHLKGVVANATGGPIVAGTVALTLPGGARPREARAFPSNDAAGGAQQALVSPDGAVSFSVAVANGGSASLEFSFLAEQ